MAVAGNMVQIGTGICTPIVASNARTSLARTDRGILKGVSTERILLRWCFKAYCYDHLKPLAMIRVAFTMHATGEKY